MSEISVKRNEVRIHSQETFLDRTILRYLGKYLNDEQRDVFKELMKEYFQSDKFPKCYGDLSVSCSYQGCRKYENMITGINIQEICPQDGRVIDRLIDALILVELRLRLKDQK